MLSALVILAAMPLSFQAGAAFGRAVAVSGDTLVVGAPLYDTPASVGDGAVWVFVRSGSGWIEQQKLTASDGAAGDQFGISVSASGDTVAVGAYAADTLAGANAGSAYVFVRSGAAWAEQQKLLPTNPELSFGFSVSVSGDTAVVGAVPVPVPFLADDGAAYVFVRSGTAWAEQAKLTASDGAPSDWFGHSASVSGDTAVVGALLDKAPGRETGSAYVFAPSGAAWSEQQHLTSPLDFFALTPCRLIDTRTSGPALLAGTIRTFAVSELCQVPADAQAVAALVTAVNPGDSGNLRLYPTGQPVPLASVLNFAAGRTRAGNAIAPLGTAGHLNVRCDLPPGSTASTHFVLDVLGYFR